MSEPTLFDQPEVCDHLAKFHNTINLSGEELKTRELRNGSQTRAILDFFKLHSYRSFTPFEVAKEMGLCCPITSVRRAISDLTYMDYLMITGEKRLGEYGEMNNCWRLK